MREIACVGVLAHPLRPNTYPVAERVGEMMRQHGRETWVRTRWEEGNVTEDVKRADMVIAIGGDGAMLRAARVCAPHDVAVLGINMGNLGFLTEIADPSQCDEPLEQVLNGDYWIEQRSMLHGSVIRDGEVIVEGHALNDIVVSGDVTGRMIQMDTFIDSDWTTTYFADALVIASATGSTAYALACGGPILPPELSNILIVPAAPHLSMERSIVLAQGAYVEVYPSTTNAANVLMIADGTTLAHLQPDDYVSVRVSDYTSRFIRMRSRNYFYRSLLDRLEPRIQRVRSRNGRNNANLTPEGKKDNE